MIYLVSNQAELFESDVYKKISVQESIDMICSWNKVQYDSETKGVDAHIVPVLCAQFGNKKADVQIVVDTSTVDLRLYKEALEGRLVIGQNLLFDLPFLYNFGIHPTKIYDTMIAEMLRYLAYPPGMYRMSLKEVALRYLKKNIDKSVRGKIKYLGLVSEVIVYAANDVVDLIDIMNLQVQYFKSINAMKALQIECSFTLPCAYYEFCGVKIDEKSWVDYYHNNLKEFEKAKEELNAFVVKLNNPKFIYVNTQGDLFNGWDLTPKCTINWNSTDDVIPLLKYLGFSTKGYNKKKKDLFPSPFSNLVCYLLGICLCLNSSTINLNSSYECTRSNCNLTILNIVS
jgi:hypothetical protein